MIYKPNPDWEKEVEPRSLVTDKGGANPHPTEMWKFKKILVSTQVRNIGKNNIVKAMD